MSKKIEDSIIEFEAVIPQIKSAILVDGQGGGQFKLEVSEQYMEQLKAVMNLRGEVLTVTIKKS